MWQRVDKVPGLAVPALYLAKVGDTGDAPEPLPGFVSFLVAHSSRSSTWMVQRARGIGLFHDFLTHKGHPNGMLGKLDRRSVRHLSSAFGTALNKGTILFSGSGMEDPTGLMWAPAASENQMRAFLRGIADFFDWVDDLRDEAGGGDRKAVQRATGASASRAHGMPKDADLFAHLRHLRGPPREIPGLEAIRRNEPTSSGTYRFPAAKLDGLFVHGFTPLHGVPGREDLTAKLVAMLCAFGGLRCSETLHLWVSDIDFADGGPVVFIHHPAAGKLSMEDGASITRGDRLMLKYGMLPRNLDPGRHHAGWKGVTLGPDGWSKLHWRWTDRQRHMFVATLDRYLAEERPRLMRKRRRRGLPDHPFLLVSAGSANREDDVSDQGDVAGDPYTMVALHSGWRRAIRRLATRTGDASLTVAKVLGTTIHGLRHAYLGALADERVDPLVIAACARHRSVLSQAAYTRPTATRVNQTLARLAPPGHPPSGTGGDGHADLSMVGLGGAPEWPGT